MVKIRRKDKTFFGMLPSYKAFRTHYLCCSYIVFRLKIHFKFVIFKCPFTFV